MNTAFVFLDLLSLPAVSLGRAHRDADACGGADGLTLIHSQNIHAWSKTLSS